jgi:hypothetical protein
MGTAWERHGMCESVFKTAWERQGNGMGTAWERHGMCESAFSVKHGVTCTKLTLRLQKFQ